jgi:hypothetical protein
MSNQVMTALALTNATATTNGPDLENVGCKGGHFAIYIGNIAGSAPTATFTVQGKDPVGGGYYTIIASTALNTSGATTILKVYPGMTASANAVVSDVIPRWFRVIVTAGGTVSDLDCHVTASLVV